MQILSISTIVMDAMCHIQCNQIQLPILQHSSTVSTGLDIWNKYIPYNLQANLSSWQLVNTADCRMSPLSKAFGFFFRESSIHKKDEKGPVSK